MKKLFAIIVLSCGLFGFVQAQTALPYEKMLSLTQEQLKEGKFKYDKYRNQYVLRKSNGLNATANVLNALNGHAADVRPHPDDYQITIQQSENETVAWVDVLFYKDETYHQLLTWARDNGCDLIETSSGKLTKQQFNYEDYNLELTLYVNGVQTTTSSTAAIAKTKDESYNTYHFTIYTKNPAVSDFLTKQAAKEAKRDAKGKKKQSVEDLM
ncbi:hypothetical protein [uncultured Rikenella sp.]|uniref:hypothetical protein n=1 Tax=uncultured Rikenella sp. TaxID=368003 RepID=UPI00262155BC|nr:hypothetical protein [uncultured Rikenella sp.]